MGNFVAKTEHIVGGESCHIVGLGTQEKPSIFIILCKNGLK